MKSALIFAIAFLAISDAQAKVSPMPIDTFFKQSPSAFFAVSRDAAGKWSSRHKDSYYAGQIGDQQPVFTVTNGAMGVSVAPNGTVEQTCVFGATVPKISEMPGGWFGCDRIVHGPVGFKLLLGGATVDPSAHWACRTSYVAHVLPVTEYDSETLQVKTVVCPPISADGSARPRGMIWGIQIRNVSGSVQTGTLLLSVPDALITPDAKSAASSSVSPRTDFSLKPGKEQFFSVAVANKGDESALNEIATRDAAAWLAQTCAYWRRVTGDLTIPGDPFTAELFIRKTIISLQSGVFDRNGSVADVLPATYPFWAVDNAKDFYYVLLPAAQRDPALLRPFIAWFAHNAIRPPGPKYPGGISSSLGCSLNALLLAGLYYDATGDGAFFKSQPELVKTLNGILEQVLATRKSDGPWLFPSRYVSDGRSLGDYHTGSNVCAWRSFSAFSRILQACGDTATADRYREIAARIRQDLDSYNIIAGPDGPQYTEGVNADRTVPVMIHDGEESDTTLMPFYGYCAVGSAPYQNFMRFAASPQNVAFNPVTRGIVWENYGANSTIKPVGGHETDATFPGYVTALAGCTTEAALQGTDGFLSEIRRLTDVNGMWWWWPYKVGAQRGDVQRHPFECGWAAGTFAVLFPTNFLGIRYDAPTTTFHCVPAATVGDFAWKNFPFGNDHFSVISRKGVLLFTNLTNHSVRLETDTSRARVVPPGGSVRVKRPASAPLDRESGLNSRKPFPCAAGERASLPALFVPHCAGSPLKGGNVPLATSCCIGYAEQETSRCIGEPLRGRGVITLCHSS